MYHPHHFQPKRLLLKPGHSIIFDAAFKLYKQITTRLATLDNTCTEHAMTAAFEIWIDLALLTERIDKVEREGVIKEVKSCTVRVLRRFGASVGRKSSRDKESGSAYELLM
ncbi:hypothetical protein LTR17_010735 [Elasticomyces elasticus]|nr:hypothetical protein LTR17_010735 [Elasticomyces elasticus]